MLRSLENTHATFSPATESNPTCTFEQTDELWLTYYSDVIEWQSNSPLEGIAWLILLLEAIYEVNLVVKDPILTEDLRVIISPRVPSVVNLDKADTGFAI